MASVSQVSHIAPEQLAPWTEEQVQQHLAAGKLVEGIQHMSPKYLEGMRRILTVSADTELVSAPSYLRAAQHAPALNNFGSAMSIIQDELAHAHIGYRLLGDLGVDMDELIYERPARAFKYPYAFDVPLNSWVELVCANALYDQAGFVLLSDVFHSSTFGPWKRALAKVDKEETFHLRHGRTWIRKLVKDPSGKAEVQAAIDWMFILTLEWFGLPDELKHHSEQLDYGFKGKSNDQLRQWWMSEVVPFMEEVGIRVPAHKAPPSGAADQPTKAPPSGAADRPNDAIERDGYVIDCPFPAAFDEEKRSWLLEDGAISWDDVQARWRARGPMNDDYVRTLQRGYQTTSLRKAA
jgi:ring-1,2-phenylacetyl-CoA epoxidase subunit PaaA